MKKSISRFLPLMFTVLLLVGCKGSPITKEEATSRAQDIEEHYSSQDFASPTKFSVTQDIKMEVESSIIEMNAIETLDLSAKYYYSEAKATIGEVSQLVKSWVYYQANENKTYYVIETNTTKGHAYFEGDLFSDNVDLEETLIADIYGSVAISGLLLTVNDEDSRNVYRSSGEGSLYLKVYVDSENENAYAEMEIDKYMVILVKSFMDDNNHMTMKFKYSGISTSKPNLSDYPYMG